MTKYELNFTAYVSDSIVIEADEAPDLLDEYHVRQNWEGLPLINGATYDWDWIDLVEVVNLDEDEQE